MRPHSFPSVTRSGPTFPSALSHLARPLRSALPFVWLVAGDSQHMARLWDRACPAESTSLLRIVEDGLAQVGLGRWAVWCLEEDRVRSLLFPHFSPSHSCEGAWRVQARVLAPHKVLSLVLW